MDETKQKWFTRNCLKCRKKFVCRDRTRNFLCAECNKENEKEYSPPERRVSWDDLKGR